MDFSIVIISFAFLCSLHHSQAFHFHYDNSTDQEALLSFKSSITSDPFEVLNSWHPNTSFCSWHGVLCNPVKQRVIGLQLGNHSLTGTITPHITNLSFLRLLDLQNNSFYGQIPSEIHRLFRLRVLVLSSNNINGSIPPLLSHCSKLRILHLSDNQLQGRIPSELGILSELQYLNLDQNKIYGVIPSSFGNLSSLKDLSLASNNIVGSIPPDLGRLSRLRWIQLWNNSLSGTIPTQLLNISSLIDLITTQNKISGNLPFNFFTALPNLEYVLMGANRFYGHIPSSLSNATKLRVLELSMNQFSGKIPLFGKLGKIEVLTFQLNQITSEGLDGLDCITSLTNLSSLREFSVHSNRLTGQLPSSIGNISSKLDHLSLGQNQLSGKIPQEIGNLRALARLSMELNSFTGEIPSSIGNLGNLLELYLDFNFLSGSIPETLGNLSNLYLLQLSINNLTGEIPPSLSNCQKLEILVLIGDGLSGNIPKGIFGLASLRELHIASNNLTGFLPSEIAKLKRIEHVDLSNNQLSGVIPTGIGDCSNLNSLNLSKNSFQGPIPKSLTNLKGIEYIDLSSNRLSGTLPSLDSLPFLYYLNISMNMLEGEVPKDGIFINTSGIFLSGNGKLCGGIPELGLPTCTAPETGPPSWKRHKKLVIGLVAGVIVSIIFSLFLFFCIKRRKPPDSNSMEVNSFEGPHKLYTYYELKSVTEDFSDENLIGKGSFGSVYKGVMRDGTLAAIKVLNMDQHGAIKSFLSECEVFRNIRHRNLLKIFSVCSTTKFKALVLQFMPNGSLETWLHRRGRGEGEDGSRRGLSLKERFDIALDVASAMEYLHHECETPVVHCDLKPSNVLLDDNMVAHVGDFGLARMLQNHGNLSNPQQNSTIGLKGSIGYIAPEYGFGVGVSTKGDVYSYGILILEMFTGRKPSAEMFNGGLNLQRWVANALPNMVMDILDEDLKEVVEIQVIEHLISIMKIGLICASESPEERFEMKEVTISIKKVQALIFQ